jgi:hypothetical protein
MSTPPDSPPAAPVIPSGLSTKVGLAGTGILSLVAAVQPFLDGAHDSDARFYAATAAALAAVTIFGRMLQAAAAFLSNPHVAEAARPVISEARELKGAVRGMTTRPPSPVDPEPPIAPPPPSPPFAP